MPSALPTPTLAVFSLLIPSQTISGHEQFLKYTPHSPIGDPGLCSALRVPLRVDHLKTATSTSPSFLTTTGVWGAC